MSDAQRRSYDTLFPKYGVPFEKSLLNYPELFGAEKPVIIEIGFGMGIATAQISQDNPDVHYVGVEVHRPGIGRLLWEIERRELKNIRIIEHDGVEVLEAMIADHSVAGFHIFFPDPWRKKRHHKRRLITRPFTGVLAAKLQPSGYIYIVTDWPDYASWALAELSATPGLANCCAGFAPPQEWRPKTKFEQKGLDKNHQIYELLFSAVET
jgi:tRNA (guanine-N7-)-methyltransferase